MKKIVEFILEGKYVGGLYLEDNDVIAHGYIPSVGEKVEVDTNTADTRIGIGATADSQVRIRK